MDVVRVEDGLDRTVAVVERDAELLGIGVARDVDDVIKLAEFEDATGDGADGAISIGERCAVARPIDFDYRDRLVAEPLGNFVEGVLAINF